MRQSLQGCRTLAALTLGRPPGGQPRAERFNAVGIESHALPETLAGTADQPEALPYLEISVSQMRQYPTLPVTLPVTEPVSARL
ncbi:MAG: hypothetical protein ACREFR_03105 [Limisphaerales bacterium]